MTGPDRRAAVPVAGSPDGLDLAGLLLAAERAVDAGAEILRLGRDEHQPLTAGVGDEPPVGRDLRRAAGREPARIAAVVACHPDRGVRGPGDPLVDEPRVGG